MPHWLKQRWPALALAATIVAAAPGSPPIPIVAAENFYADVARQIAGPGARIDAVLSNPDQDPHLFEASPSVAREVAGAQVAIESGAGYDPWMDSLLGTDPTAGRSVIVVAGLVGHRVGDNPHVWYDPATMPALAKALTGELCRRDAAGCPGYEQRRDTFLGSLAPLTRKVADMRVRYAGQAVTATEPVFGYMAKALGLVVRNERFQLAVMNDSEPRASDIAAFETDLRQHRVRALLYNSQATGPTAQRMLGIAHEAGVPVVGVTETEPGGTRYQDWMLHQLDVLDIALSPPL